MCLPFFSISVTTVPIENGPKPSNGTYKRSPSIHHYSGIRITYHDEITIFLCNFSFSPVGRIEKRRNIQWALGQLRHMDEYKFTRSHLHIKGMRNVWMTIERH